MPFSLVLEGKVVDVVCRRAKEVKGRYNVYVGETYLGCVHDLRGRHSGWHSCCEKRPDLNWMGEGFVTRYHAIEFMLKQAGYRKSPREQWREIAREVAEDDAVPEAE